MSIALPTAKAWRPLGASLLCAAAVCAIFLAPGWEQGLEYTRQAVGRGELWRLFTCHLTHWTLEHLLWDLAAFSMLLTVCLRINVRQTILITLLSLAAIPAAVWLFHPQMESYRGLSGVDTALFAYAIIHTLRVLRREGRRKELLVVCGLSAGFCLKMVFELATGQTVFVSSMGENVVGVPLAHIVGAICGGVPFLGESLGKVALPATLVCRPR